MAEMKIKKNVDKTSADRLIKMIRNRWVALSDAHKNSMDDEVIEAAKKLQLWTSVALDMFIEE